VKYHVRIGSRTVVVEVNGGRVVVDGTSQEAHLAAVPGTPLYHLLLSGESWTVAAQPLEGLGESGGPRWVLGAVGERVEVEAVDDRTRQIQALTGRRSGGPASGVVRAPMPGLVVRVEVAAGQRVPAGAALVVVEAMKMENELRAARPGVVAKVHVEAGTAVEKGAPLVTFAGDDEAEPSG
jgi:pyruvate carboxylase subunit B